MRSHPLLVAAAAVHAVAAGALVFAPDETMRWLGVAPAPGSGAVVAIAAGALLGLALLDWYSRFTNIGGIYGRPLVLANLAQAMVAAGGLGSGLRHGVLPTSAWGLLAVYALLLLWFGWVMTHPAPVSQQPR